jgi:acetolactate decarboxylase
MVDERKHPMKAIRVSILAVFLLVGMVHAQDRDVLYQLSSMAALKAGVYDGFRTVADVKQHGDFGIGTFEAINGEMIALDDAVYQVKTDGHVYTTDDSTQTCYAVVTFFDDDKTMPVEQPMDYSQLKTWLDGVLPTNIPCAIRIEGTFKYVKSRSVHPQSKPYPPLDAVVKNQVVFEFTNVTGTAVGFRFPAFMDGVQAPGYHLHFLTQNREAGGHLLDCRIWHASVKVDFKREFLMELPE